jgi:hypothetical protein
MVIVRQWISHPDIIVIHGACPLGADNIAKEFCENWGIPQDPHPADWDKYGKPAGHIRNKEMVDLNPDYAVFFMEGPSRGTTNCLTHAIAKGIPHRVYGKAGT